MRDELCVQFLQWALPRMHMRWAGFRKVRRQVCKRVDRRICELGLADADAYREYLADHADEWARLDSFCRITISRFRRDAGTFDALEREVLPALVAVARGRGDASLRAWSAGCASGEEPYTLAALWALELQSRFPDVALQIVATDADPTVLERARNACYGSGSLKSIPAAWRDGAFLRRGERYEVRSALRHGIEFLEQDIRCDVPPGRFDLVLCRNLAFTYFDESIQLDVLGRILNKMHTGAALVLGGHEQPPRGSSGIAAWIEKAGIYKKLASAELPDTRSATHEA